MFLQRALSWSGSLFLFSRTFVLPLAMNAIRAPPVTKCLIVTISADLSLVATVALPHSANLLGRQVNRGRFGPLWAWVSLLFISDALHHVALVCHGIARQGIISS